MKEGSARRGLNHCASESRHLRVMNIYVSCGTCSHLQLYSYVMNFERFKIYDTWSTFFYKFIPFQNVQLTCLLEVAISN